MKYFLIFVWFGLFTMAVNANSGETHAVLKSFKEYPKSSGIEGEIVVRRRRKHACENGVRICRRQCKLFLNSPMECPPCKAATICFAFLTVPLHLGYHIKDILHDSMIQNLAIIGSFFF
uniref:C2H2-type domain-containing protein n=1 Tax=Glossina austeni TaxID=7395 RepID=A0A1A9VSU0_GLOAU